MPIAKLTYEDKEQILEMGKQGLSSEKIAESFPVNRRQISRILAGTRPPENRELARARGLRHYYKCKDKYKIYKAANKDKIKDYLSTYYRENKERFSEQRKSYFKTYIKLNRAKLTAKENKRRAIKLKATPNWLTSIQLEEINYFYNLSYEAKLLTGDKYHVDHIIPPRGKNVCGLHVPWNLQVLPSDLNISKGNKIQCAL